MKRASPEARSDKHGGERGNQNEWNDERKRVRGCERRNVCVYLCVCVLLSPLYYTGGKVLFFSHAHSFLYEE